jgi:hypothetical protein
MTEEKHGTAAARECAAHRQDGNPPARCPVTGRPWEGEADATTSRRQLSFRFAPKISSSFQSQRDVPSTIRIDRDDHQERSNAKTVRSGR